jgi:hypothetical protein
MNLREISEEGGWKSSDPAIRSLIDQLRLGSSPLTNST